MQEQKSVSVIIPALNEEKGLEGAIKQLEDMTVAHNWEIIVVDDGSTDRTSEIANHLGINLIKQPYTKGYGAALKSGIKAAKSEILVFMDADGQHKAEDISRLLEEMGTYDMVVGARSKNKGNDWMRKPGKWFLGFVANYLTGVKIPDINCGFRAVKKKCAEEFLPLYPNGFSLSTTLTLAMFKGGYNIKYIPITINQRQGRKSTVKQGYDGSKTLLLILRCIMLFNPLKVFFPISVFLIIFGVMFASYSLYRFSNVANSAIIILLSGIFVFLFGLIADQLSVIRRYQK